MDTILKYLQNPMTIGIFNLRFIADFSKVKSYLEELLSKEREEFLAETTKRRVPATYKKRQEDRFARYSESLSGLEETEEYFYIDNDKRQDEYFKRLASVLRDFSRFDVFPEKLGNWFYEIREMEMPSGIKTKRRITKNRDVDFFGSRIVTELNDVFSIEKKSVGKESWLFDVISIKETSVAEFNNFLGAIPPLEGKIEKLKERKQFSSRYVFRPYALATRLWLQSKNSLGVPADLKSFLRGASNYLLSGEWRTSVVLSAICVESMLADMYEEKLHNFAPDTPLGDLYRLVKEKIVFPQDIAKAIETTNEARISAVHRSRLPVSDKEALSALWGATCLALWYTSNC